MLQAVRKFSASPIGKAIFIVVLIAFAGGFWYVGDTGSIGGGGGTWAVRVGDKEIGAHELSFEYARELERIRRESNEPVSQEDARAAGLPQQVIARMVNRSLLDLAAQDLSLAAGPDQVRAAILATPSFQNAEGTFDRDVYRQSLTINGFTEARFEAEVRDEVKRRQLLSTLESGIVAPPVMAETYYRVAAERRRGDVIIVRPVDPATLAVPTDSELRAAYEENKERFLTPEYRTLTVLMISNADVAAEMTVSDEELAEAYEERSGEYTTEEKRVVRQIVVADEDTARRIHDRLTEGGEFAAVAQEEAGLSPEALALGSVTRQALFPNVAEVAFALTEGGIGEPVQTALGWTIVTIDEILAAERPPLTDLADQLRADVAREKAVEVVYDLSARLQDELAAGGSLDQAAGNLNLPLIRIDSVAADGTAPDGFSVDGVEPAILEVAFQTEEGQESLLTEVGDEGAFIVRVDRIQPPADRGFDAVRSEIEALVRRERVVTAAAETATTIEERLNGGADPKTIAAEYGLEVQTTGPFDRSGAGTDLPALVVEVLFKMNVGEAETLNYDGVQYVGHVREILSADPASDPSNVQQLGALLTTQLRREVSEQLIAEMRKRHPVTINQAVTEQIF